MIGPGLTIPSYCLTPQSAYSPHCHVFQLPKIDINFLDLLMQVPVQGLMVYLFSAAETLGASLPDESDKLPPFGM